MRLWQKGWLILAAFTFLLILIGGADRLIGHEEVLPDVCTEVRELVPAVTAAAQTASVTERGNRYDSERFHQIDSIMVPLGSVQIRTDANGTVIRGRRSYLHLRYQAFSLSDGFV